MPRKTTNRKRFKEYFEVFRELPEDRQKALTKIVEYCVNLESHLDKIEKVLLEQGFVEVYNNGGGQSGTKESTYAKTYATLMKLYNANLKLVIAAMPREIAKDEDDGFDDFLEQR